MKLNVILVKLIQLLACGRNKIRNKIFTISYFSFDFSYRCLRCFNYDLCQSCFFAGDHTKNHDGSHPIEEYCKQVCRGEENKQISGANKSFLCLIR